MECHERVFPDDVFQAYIWCQSKEFDLQELLLHEHQPFTSALGECGRLQSCPKFPSQIYVITSYNELSADVIIVDGLECAVNKQIAYWTMQHCMNLDNEVQ